MKTNRLKAKQQAEAFYHVYVMRAKGTKKPVITATIFADLLRVLNYINRGEIQELENECKKIGFVEIVSRNNMDKPGIYIIQKVEQLDIQKQLF